MKYRLLHNQASTGALLVADIEDGLPNRAFGLYQKQPVYVSYYRQYRDVDGMVQTDRTLAGFIDLIPSDNVLLSVEHGTIKGLSDNNFLTVIEIAAGDLDAPTLSAATHDTTTSVTSAVNDGLATLTGTGFLSTLPYETTVSLTDGVSTVVVTAAQITADGGSAITDTSITISAALSGFATNGTEDLTTVIVTADDQPVTSAVTIV